MVLRNSASLIVFLLTAGTAWAVQVDKDTSTAVTPLSQQDIDKLPQSSAPTFPPLPQTAHERTASAAKKSQEASDAAAAALCGKDKALQKKTADAAAQAQREFEAAATEEVEQMREVEQAHDAAINATIAQQGQHSPEETKKLNDDANAKWDAYDNLRNERRKSTMEAALRAAGSIKKANCPTNTGAGQQRDANAAPNPIPPLPATPGKVIGMLNRFDDSTFKATLAEPEIRVRVEVVLNLEGCDWRVSPNALRQQTARNAAAYLNKLSTPDLRQAFSGQALQGRVDYLFDRAHCTGLIQPDQPPVSALPPANNPNSDDGPYLYPYGYPQGDYGRGDRPGDRPGGTYGPGQPGPYGPGGPYGGYGGYNW